MRRLAATRFGFFALAAAVSAALAVVIEPEHRWLAVALAALYAILSLAFLLEEAGRSR